MSQQDLREQLYASFKNRAMMYYHIFQELRTDVGDEKAEEIMKRGIYNRGREMGKRYAKYGPADLDGLKNAFLASSADNGKMFEPEVLHCDAERLDIKMNRCPLKEAWQQNGLGDLEIAKMCRIAAAVDGGTFEGAGFRFSAKTWEPDREGCCLLQIRPGR